MKKFDSENAGGPDNSVLSEPPEARKSLKGRAVRSGAWIFSSMGLVKLFNIIQTVILMRILLPEDFGRAAIALIIVHAAQVFSETGGESLLVQNKKVDRNILDTTWTIFIVRGFFIFALLFLISPIIADFFENRVTSSMIRVAATIFLVGGFNNVGTILLKRELYFRKLVLAQIVVTVLETFVVIMLAVILRSAWAIIGGHLMRGIFALIISYIIHPYRPSLYWGKNIAKRLFHFGKYILGSGVVSFFIDKGGDALVGKLLGSSQVGFYTLSYSISNLPATYLKNSLFRLTFPLYSRLQDKVLALREAYFKTFRIVRLLAFPAATILFVLAKEIIMTVFGEKWLPMLPALKILCIYGLLRSLLASGGSILVALGKPRIETAISAFQLAVMGILIYPLTSHYGILGTAIATLAGLGIVFFPGMVIRCHSIGLPFRRWLATLLVPVLASFAMALSIFALRVPLSEPGWFPLAAMAATGIISYSIVVLVLERNIVKEIYDILLIFKE